jgi:hypothetical protein
MSEFKNACPIYRPCCPVLAVDCHTSFLYILECRFMDVSSWWYSERDAWLFPPFFFGPKEKADSHFARLDDC